MKIEQCIYGSVLGGPPPPMVRPDPVVWVGVLVVEVLVVSSSNDSSSTT